MNTMSKKMCRWGILGTAGIARKNYRGIWLSGNGRVAAVASRKAAAAAQFISECQQENAFSPAPDAVHGYDELLRREDVDAVYIPLPTVTRKEWVLRAAEAGKHILCEKPIAESAADVREMLAACDRAGVQFMDGVMFMHSARLAAMRSCLDDPIRLGKIRRIQSHFSFLGDATFRSENIRVMRQLEPHGCLGDLGWYNIRLTLWGMNWKMPTRVSARTLTSLTGKGSTGTVPGELVAELDFDDATASFYCSFTAEISQWAVVTCEHGYLSLEDFVLPFFGNTSSWKVSQHSFRISGCRFNMERRTAVEQTFETSNGEPDAQEVVMVRRFGELALSGERDSFWSEVALKTQVVLDACAASAAADGLWVSLGAC
jgi:predicted dehydrogenase